MCTAIYYKTDSAYFGRTLDYERQFDEKVIVVPRRLAIPLRHCGVMTAHYAMIGMASVVDGFPLLFDACNEYGVAMAGLLFPGNACYRPFCSRMDNITPFELIPWVLGQCRNLSQARSLLVGWNPCNEAFRPDIPLSPLHWMAADESGSIVIEATEKGVHICDNPVGVLANNPPFPQQMFQLNLYRHLSPAQPENTFCPEIDLPLYSRGMGALGLPGDASSVSRFVRTAFAKNHSVCESSDEDSITQFFHILDTAAQIRGCTVLDDGAYALTQYTSCCSLKNAEYYYTTYDNRCITAISLHDHALDAHQLYQYPLLHEQTIHWRRPIGESK